jgi:transcriptional regulator with XRE-family HTH domain
MELRKSKNLSRGKLAELADVSLSSVVRMEEGKQKTSEDVTEKVLKALSEVLGYEVRASDVDGLELYNVMRDRKERRSVTDEQRVYELAAALLLLAKWYEGDTGSVEPLDKVRAYLETFPVGRHVLEEELENRLSTELLPDEEKPGTK